MRRDQIGEQRQQENTSDDDDKPRDRAGIWR